MGHPDTAAGAKITVIKNCFGRACALLVIRTEVTAVNSGEFMMLSHTMELPLIQDAGMMAREKVDLPFKTIEELRDIAYSIVESFWIVAFEDRVVGIIEA